MEKTFRAVAALTVLVMAALLSPTAAAGEIAGPANDSFSLEATVDCPLAGDPPGVPTNLPEIVACVEWGGEVALGLTNWAVDFVVGWYENIRDFVCGVIWGPDPANWPDECFDRPF